VIKERGAHGRQEKASFCIIDAQSAKNTDTAEEKGYDAGKKVSGIKRHIEVDTQGLPHAIAVTTANVTDRKGALLAFSRRRGSSRLRRPTLYAPRRPADRVPTWPFFLFDRNDSPANFMMCERKR
jgi:hypothetical protein